MNNNIKSKIVITFIVGIILGGVITFIMMSYTVKQVNHEMMNTSMHDDMSAMNAKLIGKNGDELNKAFLEEMIVHHQGAVEMAKILKSGTNKSELSEFADKIINAQDPEINQMQKWLNNWYSK